MMMGDDSMKLCVVDDCKEPNTSAVLENASIVLVRSNGKVKGNRIVKLMEL